MLMRLTSEEGEEISLSLLVRESPGLKFCPSAADLLELRTGTEFLVDSLVVVLLLEDEEADE